MTVDKSWRTSYMNHLVRLAKGEEPNAFAMAARQSRGTGHIGEWLTEHALAHGGLPGRTHTWSNVLGHKDGAVVDEAELGVLMLHGRGVFVFESENCMG